MSATTAFILEALLLLNRDQFNQGMKGAASDAEKGGSSIGKALGTAAKVGAVALTTATTAAVAFGKSAVDAGMEFDSSMSQVAATMGYTVAELNDENSEAAKNMEMLGEFAQEMGRTTAFSASEAADALNYMALAGYSVDQSMKMLPNVLNLAAAGNIDLARASDMVTDAQSALGLSEEQTIQMVDQMAVAASKTNTSVEQLGDAILTIGATARSVSGGTEELATVLGILADNGIKGSEGGTHLRNIITSLITPTKDGAEALAQLGMSYEDMYDEAGNLRSLPEIFEQMSAAMEGMSQQSRDAIIGGVFNKADLAAINALLGTDVERWEEVTAAIGDASGAAEEMAKTQLDNLAGDITYFKSALEGAQLAISEGITPTLREFVKFGTSSLSTLTEAFKKDGIEGVMDALPDIVEEAIGKLSEILPDIMKVGLTLLEAIVSGIVENLPTLLKGAIEIIKTLAQDIIENLPKILDAGIEILFALIDGIIEALPDLIPAVVDVILTIVEKLTDPDMIVKLIDAAFQIIGAIAMGLINALPKIIEKAPEIIGNLIDALMRLLPQLLESGTQLVAEIAVGITSAIHKVTDSAKEIFYGIRDSFLQRVEDAKNWGKDLIQNFINGIVEKATALWDEVKGIASGIANLLGFSEPKEGPLSRFHTFAPDMMELFAKGVRDNEDMLKDTVADAFDFGSVTVDSANTFGNGSSGFADDSPITIIVQSVLDGEIIGETATKWQRRQARAYG